jgi:hypothetical protein
VFLIFIRWCVGIDEPHHPHKKPQPAAILPASRVAPPRKDAA